VSLEIGHCLGHKEQDISSFVSLFFLLLLRFGVVLSGEQCFHSFSLSLFISFIVPFLLLEGERDWA